MSGKKKKKREGKVAKAAVNNKDRRQFITSLLAVLIILGIMATLLYGLENIKSTLLNNNRAGMAGER